MLAHVPFLRTALEVRNHAGRVGGVPLKRNTLLVSLVATSLLAFAAVSTTTAVIALPLSAVLLTVAIAVGRPQVLAWRLALLGSAFWAVEETAWAWLRLFGSSAPTLLTDLGAYGGTVLWLAALLLLPGRRRPGRLSLLFVPAVAVLLGMSASNLPLFVDMQFPFTDMILAIASLPALESALRGKASEGRMLWTLALFLRAMTAGAYTWLFDIGGLDHGFYLLWLLPYVFLALGTTMQRSHQPGSLWASASTLVGLETATGLMLYLMYRSGEFTAPLGLGVVLVLGYFQFVGVMLMLVSDRQRRVEAEDDLRGWSGLLDGVLTVDPDSPGAVDTLKHLLTALAERLPEVSGVVVHAEDGLQAGLPSSYAYPLVTGGAEIGRIYFSREPAHIGVLDAVAPFLAGRIQQTLEQSTWRTHALTDPLTGLLNRRGLDLRLEELSQRAATNDVPMSVLMLDLDHFKRVNDQYGHATGDRALYGVADVLRANVRGNDAAVRWGGEEFLVLLFDASLETAHEVAKRIQADLRANVGRPVAWPLTLSVGVAGGRPPTGSADLRHWITVADLALYHAKNAGRDRVETIT